MALTKQSTNCDSVRPRLYVALELSSTTWRLAISDGSDRVREKAMAAGDEQALVGEVERAKRRFGLDATTQVVSAYEAGRDGFWVHRFVERLGIKNVVVDASSMKVDRKARRAKSDRIDARQILADLVRYYRGEKGVWRVVRVPSEEEQDRRRTHRELERLKKERTQHQARIRSLLATQGISSPKLDPLLKDLDEVRNPNGTRLLAGLKAEIVREKERLDLVRQQIRTIEKEQQERLKDAKSPELKKVEALALLRGIGIDSAWLLVMEFFAWRDFHNRREVAGAAGLGGTPYSSGSSQREQGISKAGNPRVRTRMVELAWLWLRFQPRSQLTRWFKERFAAGGARRRRTGIVALARRLLIELWHLVEHGVVPAGAVLKVA